MTETGPDLALYYVPTPNGWKNTICLEEMRLPYRICPVTSAGTLPEGFLAASRMARSLRWSTAMG